jgi:outer membrane autotransporter protein
MPGSGRIDTPHAGLYARYAGSSWRMHVDVTAARHRFRTSRDVLIGATRSVATSTHDGAEWSAGIQVEYPVRWGEWNLRPLAGLRHARLGEDGFSEQGAGAASLAVQDRSARNTVGSLGVALGRGFGNGAYELRVIGSHLAGDNDSPVRASLAGQAGGFTAAGVPLKRNAVTLGATVHGSLGRNLTAYLDASYEYRGSGQDAHQLTAGVRWGW